jgi:segregation and condensation protein B
LRLPPNDAPKSLRIRSRPQPSLNEFGGRSAATARVEAVLFSAGEPFSARRLAALADLGDSRDAAQAVAELQAAYEAERSAFQVTEIAGGFQLLTRPEMYPWLLRLPLAVRNRGEPLTGALLETVAIVAYRQPIMRAELETLRGVHCGDALRELMERGLIRIAGRDDSLGRPILYGTTKKFLQVFGLRKLEELPPLESERN